MGEAEEDDHRPALVTRLGDAFAGLIGELERPADIGGRAMVCRLRDNIERDTHQGHKAEGENDQRQDQFFLLRRHDGSEAALQRGQSVEENHRAEMPPQQASGRCQQGQPDPGNLPDDAGDLAILGGKALRLIVGL
jgi:hypothetical protein